MIMCAISSSFKNARFMCRHMLLHIHSIYLHTHIIYTCVCFRDDNLLLWLIRHLTLAEFQTHTYVGFVGTYLHQSYGYTYLSTQSSEPNFCNGCSKIAQKLINQLWSGFFTSYGIFFASWPSTNRIHKNLSYLEHFSLKNNLSKTKLVERSDWTIFLFHNSGNMYDSYVHLHWVLKKSYFCT